MGTILKTADIMALSDQLRQVVKITNEVIFKWNITRKGSYLGNDFVRSILLHNINKYCPYIYYRDFTKIKKLINIETDSQNYINAIILLTPRYSYLYLENKELVDELLEVIKLLPFSTLKPIITNEAKVIIDNQKKTQFNPFDFSHIQKIHF